ncbi:hypothetical protein TIFTF001_015758 [Ficus carica]|uniref:Uncharacterized protein n=1 Tax=Ficus carica TaxID=3494 RepID=A0AA88D998_FICCA|nr:hypothetical protein TIFTF001_015758 [Ficus carica]
MYIVVPLMKRLGRASEAEAEAESESESESEVEEREMVGREGKRRLGVMGIEIGNGNEDLEKEIPVGNRNNTVSETETRGFGMEENLLLLLREWRSGNGDEDRLRQLTAILWSPDLYCCLLIIGVITGNGMTVYCFQPDSATYVGSKDDFNTKLLLS